MEWYLTQNYTHLHTVHVVDIDSMYWVFQWMLKQVGMYNGWVAAWIWHWLSFGTVFLIANCVLKIIHFLFQSSPFSNQSQKRSQFLKIGQDPEDLRVTSRKELVEWCRKALPMLKLLPQFFGGWNIALFFDWRSYNNTPCCIVFFLVLYSPLWGKRCWPSNHLIWTIPSQLPSRGPS